MRTREEGEEEEKEEEEDGTSKTTIFAREGERADESKRERNPGGGNGV